MNLFIRCARLNTWEKAHIQNVTGQGYRDDKLLSTRHDARLQETVQDSMTPHERRHLRHLNLASAADRRRPKPTKQGSD